MKVLEKRCPSGHGTMFVIKLKKERIFRGVKITYETECHVCPECHIEIGTIAQGAAVQKNISDAYRKAVGLLTGQEIQKYRISLGLTYKTLADKINLDASDVKKWERGSIQSKSADNILRSFFMKKKAASVSDAMDVCRHYKR